MFLNGSKVTCTELVEVNDERSLMLFCTSKIHSISNGSHAIVYGHSAHTIIFPADVETHCQYLDILHLTVN